MNDMISISYFIIYDSFMHIAHMLHSDIHVYDMYMKFPKSKINSSVHISPSPTLSNN